VENRSGGNIEAEAVINSPPDGYTMLLAGSPNAINATLYDKLNFVFLRDCARRKVCPHASRQGGASFGPGTLAEFIADAKANPGKVNYASAGMGAPQHVSTELLKIMTGINIVHVPYRGSAPAPVDMLPGQVQGDDRPAAGLDRVRPQRQAAVSGGHVRGALAPRPDVPTAAEFICRISESWYGAGLPRNTPAEIVDKINSTARSMPALQTPGLPPAWLSSAPRCGPVHLAILAA
jgi:tripartite-type tricarboxylate transporter receptor subunit TctC